MNMKDKISEVTWISKSTYFQSRQTTTWKCRLSQNSHKAVRQRVARDHCVSARSTPKPRSASLSEK